SGCYGNRPHPEGRPQLYRRGSAPGDYDQWMSRTTTPPWIYSTSQHTGVGNRGDRIARLIPTRSDVSRGIGRTPPVEFRDNGRGPSAPTARRRCPTRTSTSRR